MSNPEIDSLIESWGEGNVRKAFWLQGKIERDGLDGIHFMHDEGDGPSAESRMKQMSHVTTKSVIESEMKESY